MAKTFEGKVVLVTGANSGIGEAIAVAFQQAGAQVFGLGRRKEALEAARARHPDIRWLRADVTNGNEVTAAVESAVREAGRLDVVVNNAGVFQFAPLEQSGEEMVRRQFEANVYGTTFVAQAALPALRASRGTIINLSSAAGHKPVPGGAHYALRAPRAQGEVHPTEDGSLRKARGSRRPRDGMPLEASISPPAGGLAGHGRPARGLAGRTLACVLDRAEASTNGVDGLPRHEVGRWVPAFSLTLDLDPVASHADDEGAALNKDGIELTDNLPA
jgi:SAM-dependent methyltransferase